MKPARLAAGLIVWIGLSVAIAKLLKLHGADFWILVCGLGVLGALSVAAIWWFTRATKPEKQPAPALDENDELQNLFREAERRLAQSQLGPGARLSTLPLFFILGESGAAKTTTMLQSGLDAELIAGQVYQDNDVMPTRNANLWFARHHVFFEPGSRLLEDGKRWQSLVGRLRPGRLLAVSKGRQAPRASLICVDTEKFFMPGAAEAVVASARKLRSRLNEISHQLGINFPVYVLFTRADRIPFFLDFVANFDQEEAFQVFGVTLPEAGRSSQRIYSEAESERLVTAFNTLYRSLTSKRPDLLIREHDATKLPGAYEFPREFRRMRSNLVSFLVELCRPSQLTASPFLRGFYFTGVRPVVVNETAPAPVRQPAERTAFDLDATSMFRYTPQARAEPVPVAATSRRVPQWVFLPHLFSNVLLADGDALACSGSSSRVSRGRRVIVATAAAACLALCGAFTVSFIKNRALEDRVLSASRGMTPVRGEAAGVPSLETLQRLDNLRQSVATLSSYEANGAPLSFRWGLYSGSALYVPARRLYFDEFRMLLFDDTERNLVETLQSLPLSPGANDDYQYAYDTLKAYLITTSYHDKSTKQYLAPVLLKRWAAGRLIDSLRLDLARRQFEFYSEELKLANLFSSENDSAAIERGRHYLSQFAGAERVYQFMLGEASKANAAVNFNANFPGSAGYVINAYDVPGAFTKSGWATMQQNLQHVDRFFAGEQWVLGSNASDIPDPAKLQSDLAERYTSDFISRWREYLKRASVVPYKSIPDAAQKLNKLSSAQSPLLAMFWLASQNTNVKNAEIAGAFKALYGVMPPSAVEQFVVPANDAYMKALAGLQVSLDQVAEEAGVPNDAAAAQTLSTAENAKLVTRQMAQNFALDPVAHLDGTVQKLLEAPITNVEGLLRSLGPAELNAKGKGLCGELSSVLTKFPFSTRSPMQAAVADIDAAFKPQNGALWTFYNSALSKYLTRNGSQFAADPSAPARLNSGFVLFFNRAAALSEMLYAGGATEPHFSYNLKPVLSSDIESITLTIDGQAAQFTAGSAAKNFQWQAGGAHGVQLSGKYKGGSDFQYPSYEGFWAVFEWIADADSRQGTTFEWSLKAGKQDRPVLSPVTNQPLVVRFDIDNPILQKGYFAGLSCTSQIARP